MGDGFQNLDSDTGWIEDDPVFEWTAEDLQEFEQEEEYAEMVLASMAAWWELEGVRCSTFGPPRNPYL